MKKACCFTGHRRLDERQVPYIQARLEYEMRELIHKGYVDFWNGGALGFDTMAALTVLKLRRELPEARLLVAIPYQGQAERWSEQSVAIYHYNLSQADFGICLSDNYEPGCMHARNRYMVDRSALCLCYCWQTTGGTAYTVDYARRRGLPVLNLAEKPK